MRKEGYQLDRQIRQIQREEDKIKKSLKEAAAKNDKDVCNILAKEVIRSKKAINKIHTSKAHLNSVQLHMKNQLGVLRIAGSLQKSTEVMQAMHALVKLPEISGTMQEMSREMTKMGILEEMIEETMESIEDTEEIEEEAQSEIDKILWEVTAGKLGQAPSVPSGAVSVAAKEEEAVAGPSVEDEDDMKEMQTRLQALRS